MNSHPDCAGTLQVWPFGGVSLGHSETPKCTFPSPQHTLLHNWGESIHTAVSLGNMRHPEVIESINKTISTRITGLENWADFAEENGQEKKQLRKMFSSLD